MIGHGIWTIFIFLIFRGEIYLLASGWQVILLGWQFKRFWYCPETGYFWHKILPCHIFHSSTHCYSNQLIFYLLVFYSLNYFCYGPTLMLANMNTIWRLYQFDFSSPNKWNIGASLKPAGLRHDSKCNQNTEDPFTTLSCMIQLDHFNNPVGSLYIPNECWTVCSIFSRYWEQCVVQQI